MEAPFKSGSAGRYTIRPPWRPAALVTAIVCCALICAWPVFAGAPDDSIDATPSASDTWQQVDESNGQVLELPQVYDGSSADADDDSSTAASAADNQDQDSQDQYGQNADGQAREGDSTQAQADPSAADGDSPPEQVGSVDDYQKQQAYGPSVVYIPIGPNYGPMGPSYTPPRYAQRRYPSGWYQAPPVVPRMPMMVPGFHGVPPGNSVMPAAGGMTSVMPARPMMPRTGFTPFTRSFGAGGGMFRR